MFCERLENVRKNTTLVHNITNYVTVNDCANILLACGASPIMADDSEEVEDITSICSALNINIGTLNKNTIPSMFLAGKKANELKHPIILDPVGAGASRLRTETAQKLIDEIKFTKEFAKRTGAIIAITGVIDIVADDEKAYVLRNGNTMMGKITGSGCMLTAMTAAYIAANKDNELEAVAASVCAMGVCGEIAYARLTKDDGNSSYRNYIIDAVYRLDGETLERYAKYEIK